MRMFNQRRMGVTWAVAVALGVGSGAIGQVQLPQGAPPQPQGTVIDVSTFGVDLADDDHDDTDAVNAAIAACTDNSTLYFPAGTYNVRDLRPISGFTGLSIRGDGPHASIIKRMPPYANGTYWPDGVEPNMANLKAHGHNDTRTIWITDCADMCIRDIAFDINGVPTFGGVRVERPNRLNVFNTRTFDSQETGPLAGRYDRFGWYIHGHEGQNFSAQRAVDVWFVHNEVEGLQVEMRGVNRLLLEWNYMARTVKSPTVGWLSANFAPGRHNPGYSSTNITVRNNWFGNSPHGATMAMVSFLLDPPHNNNTIFRAAEVTDNIFVYNEDAAVGRQPAIGLGHLNAADAATGNIFSHFTIERNRIYMPPTTQIPHNAYGYIWFNVGAGDHRLNHTVIRGNTLYADSHDVPVVMISKESESVGLTVQDNVIRPYEPPPAREGRYGNVPVEPPASEPQARATPQASWLAAVILAATPMTDQAGSRSPTEESFDSLDGLVCRPGYKTVAAKAQLNTDTKKEGAASVQVTWTAAPDHWGEVRLTKTIDPLDITGQRFEMWMMPLTAHSGYWGIEFYDDAGKVVEQHRVFHASVNTWNHLRFQQGVKTEPGWFKKGEGDPARVTRIVFRAQTREAGQTAEDLWDHFRFVP